MANATASTSVMVDERFTDFLRHLVEEEGYTAPQILEVLDRPWRWAAEFEQWQARNAVQERRCLLNKPESLTPERVLACMPALDINPEWQAREDAGENPPGLAGCLGALISVPAEEKFTLDEARYIKWLSEQGSMRWLADQLTGDSNQVIAVLVMEAVAEVLEQSP